MTNAASRSLGDGTTPASPSWVAQTLNDWSLWGGSVAGDSLSQVSDQPQVAEADTPACDAYINQLHAEWLASPNNTEQAAGLMSTTSRLWERTHMRLWELAQFGFRNGQGHRVGCHLLEVNAESLVVGPGGQVVEAQNAAGYSADVPAQHHHNGGRPRHTPHQIIRMLDDGASFWSLGRSATRCRHL